MTGAELKARRTAKGFTQKGLGLAVGYPENSAEKAVQQWEYDKHPIPIKHYRKLAKLLDLTLDDMVPYDDE